LKEGSKAVNRDEGEGKESSCKGRPEEHSKSEVMAEKKGDISHLATTRELDKGCDYLRGG